MRLTRFQVWVAIGSQGHVNRVAFLQFDTVLGHRESVEVAHPPPSYLLVVVSPQEKSWEELKAFLGKFGTLRTVESGEGTPDALFGKLNAVVVAMLEEVVE